MTYSDSGTVGVDLASGIASGHGHDRLVSIEDAQGSNYDDTLIGDRGSNELNGGNGADVVSGAGGRDHTIGGRGDDVLRGGPGHNLVDDSIGVAQGDLIPTQGAISLLEGRGGDVLNAVDEVARNDRLLGGAGRVMSLRRGRHLVGLLTSAGPAQGNYSATFIDRLAACRPIDPIEERHARSVESAPEFAFEPIGLLEGSLASA